MAIDQFELKLLSVRELTETTREFRFVRSDGLPVSYAPGQFYRFNFEDHSGIFERSYSVATWGGVVGQSEYLDLIISYVKDGRASKYLLDPEMKVLVDVCCEAKGPYGRLLVPARLPQRLLLVATSVGLAPYIPILNQLEEIMPEEDLQVELILGVRSPDEFIYHDELVDYAARQANFKLVVCYSQQMPVNPDHEAVLGYVQQYLEKISLTPEGDHFLLCGNPGMIDDVYADLKPRGFGVRNVIREKYVYAREPVAKQQQLSEEQKKLIAEKMAQAKKTSP